MPTECVAEDVYGGVMVMIRDWEQHFLSAEWRDPPLFGFEAECHCEDILMCLQSGITTALEWPERHPLCIASTDIKKAFDYVTPRVVAESMLLWRFAAVLVRGLVRESLLASAEVVCPGVPPTSDFAIQSYTRQGGMESPRSNNIAVRTIVGDGGQTFREEGLRSLVLPSVPLMGRADNLLFVGSAAKPDQESIVMITSGTHQRGLYWKASSMQYMMAGSHDRSASGEQAPCTRTWSEVHGQHTAAHDYRGRRIGVDDLAGPGRRYAQLRAQGGFGGLGICSGQGHDQLYLASARAGGCRLLATQGFLLQAQGLVAARAQGVPHTHTH